MAHTTSPTAFDPHGDGDEHASLRERDHNRRDSHPVQRRLVSSASGSPDRRHSLNTANANTSIDNTKTDQLTSRDDHSHSPGPARPTDADYFPHQPKSLAGIATRAFCLGIALTVGATGTLATLLFTPSPLWRLPFFLTALSAFHFLEFWTTAAYNTRAAEVSSFLLTSNWPGYAIAHTFAALECVFTNLVWPGRPFTALPIFTFHDIPILTITGLLLTLLGQTVRTVAMVHAGRSFNHLVQQRRNSGHVLVTTGVYGLLRHPSYFGFFWWALGTQLVMGNVVSLVGFMWVLWKFFSRRIGHEEELLVRFFGEGYVDYRRRVGVWIPFVG